MMLKPSYYEFRFLKRNVLKPTQERINEVSDIKLEIVPCTATKGPNGRYQNLIFNIETQSGRKLPLKAKIKPKYEPAKGNKNTFPYSHIGGKEFAQALVTPLLDEQSPPVPF